MYNKVQLGTLLLLSLIVAGCSEPLRPSEDGSRSPDVIDPSRGGIPPSIEFVFGPDSLPTQGEYQWSARVTNHDACVTWYRRDYGGNWVLLGVPNNVIQAWGYSIYSDTFTDPNQSDFDLRVVAREHHGSTGCLYITSYDEINVAVANPLYPPLSGSVNGPFLISSPGDYTWTVAMTGGSGTYSYEWALYYTDSGYWTGTLSTTDSLTLNIPNGEEGDIYVGVTVESGGQEVGRSQFVCIILPPNDFTCT